MRIQLSNGETKAGCRLEVWDDMGAEHRAYRLFWVVPGESTGVPAVGYCSTGGSYRTIRAAVADGERRFNQTAIRT